MKSYTLKLTSGTTYKLYDGTTLVSDADLTTLFATAGSAYVSFGFNGGTPTATDELTITNSSDTAVITNTGLTDAIEENKNYKATWSANATAFDSLEALGGVAMDESQLSNLMGKIKSAGGGSSSTLSDGQNLWELDTGLYYQPNSTTVNLSYTSASSTTPNKNTIPATGYGCSWFVLKKSADQTEIVKYSSSGVFGIFDRNANGHFIANPTTGVRLTYESQYMYGPVQIKENWYSSNDSGSAAPASAAWFLDKWIIGTQQRGTSYPSPLAWTAIGTGSSYTKRALQVTLNISETGLTIPADTWTSLGITMPTNFIPTTTMLGSVTANNNGTFEAGLVRVNTDGTVEVHTSGATTDIYGSIVFPVAA